MSSQKMSPLGINLMLAAYCTPDPASYVGEKVWESQAATSERANLLAHDMVDENFSATEKGKAWVEFIRRVPFPVEEWKIPLLKREQ